MTGLLLLLKLSLKRARVLLLAAALLLAAFQLLLVAIAGSMQGQFEELAALLPEAVRSLLGPSLASVMSFGGIACLGFFHPAVLIGLLALTIALATQPASEVEAGFADLILARPLARHWIITRTLALVALVVSLMLAVMLAGTWAGLTTLAPPGTPWPSLRGVGSLALNLGMLLFCWGGIATAFGAACRRGVAGATTGLLALAAFLLDYIGRLWPPADKFAWLSPFRYFVPFDLVMGSPLPVENIVVLWAVAMTGFVVAYLVFSQRDIAR